jgi:hypothetical protein
MRLQGHSAISGNGHDSRTNFSLDPLAFAKKMKQSGSGGSSEMEFAFGPIETLTHQWSLTVGAQTIQIDPQILKPALSSGSETKAIVYQRQELTFLQ